MSVTNVLRRGLAAAAVSATGLAVLAGAGLPAAQAAPVTTAARPASLHQTGSPVALGALGKFFSYDFSEAPDGSVYYSSGSTVYVVHGTSTPAVVMHASGHVLAVAANSSELFVEVRRTVTGYKLSNGVALRHWTLASALKPTSAGLYAVGGTVWAWTDWATDTSGFEYANVSRFKTSSGTVHKVSANNAYPADMAADSSGLYYQQAIGSGRLTHVTPSGAVHRVTEVNLDAPLALAGGRVELLAFHRNSHLYLDSYRATTLVRKFSRRVSGNDFDIAGTGAGLLVLSSSGKVSQLNASTGSALSSVNVTGAATLVAGPSAAAIFVTGGNYFLVRLAG
jgi:hypothetical protein